MSRFLKNNKKFATTNTTTAVNDFAIQDKGTAKTQSKNTASSPVSPGIPSITTPQVVNSPIKDAVASQGFLDREPLGIEPDHEALADIISRYCDIEETPEEEGQQLGSYNPETGEITTIPGIGVSTPIGSLVGSAIGQPVSINYTIVKENSQFKTDIFLGESSPSKTKEEEKETESIKNSVYDFKPVSLDLKPEGFIDPRGQGKRELFILDSLVGSSRQQFSNSNSITDNTFHITDSLRGRMGHYWGLDTNEKKFIFINKDKEVYKGLYELRFQSSNKIEKREPLDFFKEKYKIIFNQSRFTIGSSKVFSPQLLDSYVNGGNFDGSISEFGKIDFSFLPTVNLTQEFEDQVFSMDLPFAKKDFNEVQSPINSIVANVSPEYNFFIRSYEHLFKIQDVKENVLPNMYLFLTQRNYEDSDPQYTRIINLDSNIDLNGKDPGLGSIKETKGQYYDLFSNTYNNIADTSTIENLSNKMKNVVISSKDLDLIRKYNFEKENFPMNMSVQFKTDRIAKFFTILKETDLVDTFIGKIVDSIIVENTYSEKSFYKQITKSYLETNKVDPKNKTFELDTEVTQTTNRTWNLNEIFEEIQDSQEIDSLPEDIIYLGEYQNKRKSLDIGNNKFFNSLRIAILKSKLFNFLENNLRTYEEILNGKTCYNETLMYRVAKYRGKEITPQSLPIQNIFIPNDTEIDMIEYIDTQVKYEQDYTYVIYAYQFVLGNVYYNENIEDLSTAQKFLEIRNRPQMSLVEVPYYRESAIITDIPPAPPEVSLNFYKEQDNKVLIMLNGSVNFYKNFPVYIEDGDREKFLKCLKNQKKQEGEEINFGGDDVIQEFHVFRTETHPESYSDFDGNRIATLSNKINKLESNSASFVDKILPNKKFYYTFRNVDIHGNLSNPTKVIEVEMIKQDGIIYPLVNHVEFKEKKYGAEDRQVKRFIKIQPNIVQSLIDQEEEDSKIKSANQIKNKIKLGSGDDRIWDKKIKIRLTSKNTKKVLDFNVKFTHRNVNIIKNE